MNPRPLLANGEYFLKLKGKNLFVCALGGYTTQRSEARRYSAEDLNGSDQSDLKDWWLRYEAVPAPKLLAPFDGADDWTSETFPKRPQGMADELYWPDDPLNRLLWRVLEKDGWKQNEDLVDVFNQRWVAAGRKSRDVERVLDNLDQTRTLMAESEWPPKPAAKPAAKPAPKPEAKAEKPKVEKPAPAPAPVQSLTPFQAPRSSPKSPKADGIQFWLKPSAKAKMKPAVGGAWFAAGKYYCEKCLHSLARPGQPLPPHVGPGCFEWGSDARIQKRLAWRVPCHGCGTIVGEG